MGWLKRRRLCKYLKGLNFEAYKKAYGSTGEYEALLWLKAYSEKRASSEPTELVRSVVAHSPNGISAKDRLYIWTLLQLSLIHI